MQSALGLTATTLRSSAALVGCALVVHADPDDHATNLAGNSGARVLCGVMALPLHAPKPGP